MKLSIILCTYNNADSLRLTLKELSRCELSNIEEVELIVVDNNSPDNTSDIFKQVKSLYKYKINYIFEPKQGLSNARNSGLERAAGEYILFTDDDAKIPANWLQIYLDKIQQYNPDCLYSKISVVWEKPIPLWFIPEYRPFFVCLDYGNNDLMIEDVHHEFFGKNFCIRKDVLDGFGGFNPKLGRCGDRLIAGEETLIYWKLIKSRKKTIYFPDAEVGHRLKKREYEFSNMRKMYVDSAYSFFYLSKLTTRRTWGGRPLYPLKVSFKALLDHLSNLIVSLLKNDSRYVKYNKIQIAKHLKVLSLWIKNHAIK
ncbi:MAG TPA: glycosyltransferase family 2 protein [Gammaproteobacteria bacterium]|nr:glycosyltransferase family 2 protein [Gammaproteobacteria bacterium]